MVILEPDGSVSHDGYGAHLQPRELLAELVATAGAALVYVHYSFAVPGIGMVALQLDRELVAPEIRQNVVLVRSGQSCNVGSPHCSG